MCETNQHITATSGEQII